jgi:hypothetical protein
LQDYTQRREDKIMISQGHRQIVQHRNPHLLGKVRVQ